MVKEILRGKRVASDSVHAVLYEAAQAEDCFRNLDASTEDIERKMNRLDEQLTHELGKLARKGIDTAGALPPKQTHEA
jgi:predicted trehalose synthase